MVKLSLPRLPRYEILAIAAAAVIAVIVTLIVLTSSANARERRVAGQAGQAQGRQDAAPAREELSLEDFIIPEAPRPASLPAWYPFRPRMKQWSRELVEKFWVSPRQIAQDLIGTVNDRNMEEFFKDVP